MIDFNNKEKKIFFCGIGGISMSGLAEMLKAKGFEVLGSDSTKSERTEHLENLGIKVFIGQNEKNISSDIDLFVRTAAVKDDNPEVWSARKYGIKVIERSELLGSIMKNYKYVTTVAGTHGKTTTTTMISHIFMAAQKDPSISVGALVDAIGGNVRIGKSDYFIAEACEYYDSFLRFYPFVAVILNIEEDHLDYFKDINAIRKSFLAYAQLVPENGTVVINADVDNIEYITKNVACNVLTYSVKNPADFTAENIVYDEKDRGSFDVMFKGKKLSRVALGISGAQNVSNSLAAFASAYVQGVDVEKIAEGLKECGGAHRRFEYKGERNGLTVIDDYAHHPSEIKAMLDVAQRCEHNKLWCVFQPHTYSRTKAFLQEFSESFDGVDNIIIADIYSAGREQNSVGIYAQDLVDRIKERGNNAMYLGGFLDIEKFVLENFEKGDVLITVGAGDVYLVGEQILSK